MDIGEIFNVIDQMMEDHIIPNIIRRMDILCQRYKFSLGINQIFPVSSDSQNDCIGYAYSDTST